MLHWYDGVLRMDLTSSWRHELHCTKVFRICCALNVCISMLKLSEMLVASSARCKMCVHTRHIWSFRTNPYHCLTVFSDRDEEMYRKLLPHYFGPKAVKPLPPPPIPKVSRVLAFGDTLTAGSL